MKYFFVSEGWTIGRIWEFGGLWNENVWRRKPDIQQMSLYIQEGGEKLWLYRVEDAVLMVEVKPTELASIASANHSIGQVVLKRLINADQVLEQLYKAERIIAAAGESESGHG